jgi:hypothetical protein
MREGSIWTSDPEHIRRRRELAHSYVDYADTDAFVRDIREPEKKEDDVKVATDAEGSDSSQDEEEAEEGDTDVPKQGSVPGGGDGSIPCAGSGTPEANISTATAPPAGGSASAPAPQLCITKNFKLYQIPGMPGADVIYTLFPFGLLPQQVLTWFACL